MATDHRGRIVGNPNTMHGGHTPTFYDWQAYPDTGVASNDPMDRHRFEIHRNAVAHKLFGTLPYHLGEPQLLQTAESAKSDIPWTLAHPQVRSAIDSARNAQIMENVYEYGRGLDWGNDDPDDF